MSTENSFQLFTSLRYDPLLLTSTENSARHVNFITPSPFYMLVYHRDRMREAALHFDFVAVEERLRDGEALHQELLHQVNQWAEQNDSHGPLKARDHTSILKHPAHSL